MGRTLYCEWFWSFLNFHGKWKELVGYRKIPMKVLAINNTGKEKLARSNGEPKRKDVGTPAVSGRAVARQFS